MEITTFLGLLYISISLSALIIMLCRSNTRYMEYPTAVCSAIGLIIAILFLSSFTWIGILLAGVWLFNTILMGYNCYDIYKKNKE